MRVLRRLLFSIVLLLLFLISGPTWMIATGQAALEADHRTASWDRSNLAPPPEETPEAVVQVYAARAFEWRGAFSVHSWIAAKPKGAHSYTRYEVIGFRLWSTGSAVAVGNSRPPDAQWFGADPELIFEARGERAQQIIDQLDPAVARYPYPDRYEAWPGPNSNTFIAWMMAEVEGLDAVLPSNAVGKGWHDGWWRSEKVRTATGDGWVASGPFGLVGLTTLPGRFEVSILGMSFGYSAGGIILPGIGVLR